MPTTRTSRPAAGPSRKPTGSAPSAMPSIRPTSGNPESRAAVAFGPASCAPTSRRSRSSARWPRSTRATGSARPQPVRSATRQAAARSPAVDPPGWPASASSAAGTSPDGPGGGSGHGGNWLQPGWPDPASSRWIQAGRPEPGGGPWIQTWIQPGEPIPAAGRGSKPLSPFVAEIRAARGSAPDRSSATSADSSSPTTSRRLSASLLACRRRTRHQAPAHAANRTRTTSTATVPSHAVDATSRVRPAP